VRRAVAAITENGPDGVALVLSGRLDGGAIAEAGLSAMPKVAKATPAPANN
jgi:ribosomal protein S3